MDDMIAADLPIENGRWQTLGPWLVQIPASVEVPDRCTALKNPKKK